MASRRPLPRLIMVKGLTAAAIRPGRVMATKTLRFSGGRVECALARVAVTFTASTDAKVADSVIVRVAHQAFIVVFAGFEPVRVFEELDLTRPEVICVAARYASRVDFIWSGKGIFSSTVVIDQAVEYGPVVRVHVWLKEGHFNVSGRNPVLDDWTVFDVVSAGSAFCGRKCYPSTTAWVQARMRF